MKPYIKENVPLAKALRKNMTPYEKKLWYNFLSNYPIRFQRQKCVNSYIADFYCAKAQLILEIDGNGHCADEQEKYDFQRTKNLEDMGIKVIRFTNLEISDKFNGVCIAIDKAVKEQLHTLSLRRASTTPPSSDGGYSEALCDKYETKDFSKRK